MLVVEEIHQASEVKQSIEMFVRRQQDVKTGYVLRTFQLTVFFVGFGLWFGLLLFRHFNSTSSSPAFH